MKKREITPEDLKRIVELRQTGAHWTQIGRATGIGRHVVKQAYEKEEEKEQESKTLANKLVEQDKEEKWKKKLQKEREHNTELSGQLTDIRSERDKLTRELEHTAALLARSQDFANLADITSQVNELQAWQETILFPFGTMKVYFAGGGYFRSLQFTISDLQDKEVFKCDINERIEEKLMHLCLVLSEALERAKKLDELADRLLPLKCTILNAAQILRKKGQD